jgi:hypothetical protein
LAIDKHLAHLTWERVATIDPPPWRYLLVVREVVEALRGYTARLAESKRREAATVHGSFAALVDQIDRLAPPPGSRTYSMDESELVSTTTPSGAVTVGSFFDLLALPLPPNEAQ